MKFDLTSDIHIDFWVGVNGNTKKQQSIMRKLINMLLPNDKSDILVIAGDLGHYNFQNAIFIDVLKEFYRDIVIVSGNHDYYLVSHKAQKSAGFSSFNRVRDMMCIAQEKSIHWLDGNTVNIDGLVFGGCCMWYDNTYATGKCYMGDSEIQSLWMNSMNDSNLIMLPQSTFDRYELFTTEYTKMEQIISKCDVVVSHICPSMDLIPKSRLLDPVSTFYQFNGLQLIERMKQNAVWCYGHIHDAPVSALIQDHMMYSNPLGYCDDVIDRKFWWDAEMPQSRKFRTIEIINPEALYE